jgi:hypothetical protein
MENNTFKSVHIAAIVALMFVFAALCALTENDAQRKHDIAAVIERSLR